MTQLLAILFVLAWIGMYAFCFDPTERVIEAVWLSFALTVCLCIACAVVFQLAGIMVGYIK